MLKPMENYSGYFISDQGIVYSNLGQGNRRNNKTVPLYQIHPRILPSGYARVYLRNSLTNKREDVLIHRAVAKAFLPNPTQKLYVNHKNCRRDDNRVSNLEWVTARENTQQTEQLRHIVRDTNGRYCSAFDYSAFVEQQSSLLYSPLPSNIEKSRV